MNVAQGQINQSTVSFSWRRPTRPKRPNLTLCYVRCLKSYPIASQSTIGYFTVISVLYKYGGCLLKYWVLTHISWWSQGWNIYSPRVDILAIKVEFGTSRWCHLQSMANLFIWYDVTKPHLGGWYTHRLHGHLNLDLIWIWSGLADSTTRQGFDPFTIHLHHTCIIIYIKW